MKGKSGAAAVGGLSVGGPTSAAANQVPFRGLLKPQHFYTDTRLTKVAYKLYKKASTGAQLNSSVGIGTLIGVQVGPWTVGISYRNPLKDLKTDHEARQEASAYKNGRTNRKLCANVQVDDACILRDFGIFGTEGTRDMTSDQLADIIEGLFQESELQLPKEQKHDQSITFTASIITDQNSLAAPNKIVKGANNILRRNPKISVVGSDYTWTVPPYERKIRRIQGDDEDEDEEVEEQQPQKEEGGKRAAPAPARGGERVRVAKVPLSFGSGRT